MNVLIFKKVVILGSDYVKIKILVETFFKVGCYFGTVGVVVVTMTRVIVILVCLPIKVIISVSINRKIYIEHKRNEIFTLIIMKFLIFYIGFNFLAPLDYSTSTWINYFYSVIYSC